MINWIVLGKVQQSYKTMINEAMNDLIVLIDILSFLVLLKELGFALKFRFSDRTDLHITSKRKSREGEAIIEEASEISTTR